MNGLVIEALSIIPQSSEYEFFNPNTGRLIQDVKKAFKTVCENANIKGLRFYDLRHTAASKMIEAGTDIVTVSKILRHSDIKMTMRYCHPTAENMQRAVDKLGKIYEQTRKNIYSPTQQIEIKNPFPKHLN